MIYLHNYSKKNAFSVVNSCYCT